MLNHRDGRIEIEDAQPSEAGGYSLVSFIIKGTGVYSKMKFESWFTSCTACA